MTAIDLLQVAAFLAVLILLVPPLGAFMAKVFDGRRNLLSAVLGPVEAAIYKLIGADPKKEMT